MQSIFSAPEVDYYFVEERINAAYSYFFDTLDALVEVLFWQLEATKRKKKSKGLHEDLLSLEELVTTTVLRLMKAKIWISKIASRETITKNSVTSSQMQHYRLTKFEKVRNAFKELNNNLLDDEMEDFSATKKKKKQTKKSTLEETFTLWLEKNTIQEIAFIRKLSEQTIGNHIAKLIENKQISIEDILPKDKILQLEEAFIDFEGPSLNSIKEKYGKEFTWEELKMYRSSIM